MKKVVPWALGAIHSALLIGMLAARPFEPYPGPEIPGQLSFDVWHMASSTMVAGRNLHHDYLAMFLMLSDIPVILLTERLPLAGSLSPMAASYVWASTWLVGGALWWFLLAWLALRIAARTRRRDTAASPR